MKSFLLYIVLPGIVLGIVYQSGRRSATSSSVESESPVRSGTVRVVSSADQEALIAEKIAVLKDRFARMESSDSASVRGVSEGSSTKPKSSTESKSLPEPKPLSVPKAVPAVALPKLAPQTVSALDDSKFSFDPADQIPTVSSGRSVYDRRGEPASLGLMPLRPLEPLEVTSVPAQTFKAPVPAVSPSKFPIRITSSSECDCGKEH